MATCASINAPSPVAATGGACNRRLVATGTLAGAIGMALVVAGAAAQEVPVSPGDFIETQPIYYPLTPRRNPDHPGLEYPDDMLRQFMDLHTAGRYELAAEMALRLAETAPNEPLVHYNVACVMARMRRTDEALEALRLAVDSGWCNVVHASFDPDLEPLRGDERFSRLLGEMRRLAEAQRLPTGPLRLEPPEQILAEVREALPSMIETVGVPGVVAVYVRNGAVAWAHARGVSDLEAQRRLQVDDRFGLRTPAHVLALVAAERLASSGRTEPLELVMTVIELDQTLAVSSPGLDRGSRRASAGDGFLRVSAPRIPGSTVARRAGPALRLKGALVYDLLRHEVEIAADETFRTYCDRDVLAPLGMTRSAFIPPRDADAAIAVGHSRFGTPVQAPGVARRDGEADLLFTTAEDLARLLIHLMDRGQAGPGDVRDLAYAWRRSGLALRGHGTPRGTRLDLVEQRDGVGCLVRGYPQAGIGVVVLYNGQAGDVVAERIARMALGGGK